MWRRITISEVLYSFICTGDSVLIKCGVAAKVPLGRIYATCLLYYFVKN